MTRSKQPHFVYQSCRACRRQSPESSSRTGVRSERIRARNGPNTYHSVADLQASIGPNRLPQQDRELSAQRRLFWTSYTALLSPMSHLTGVCVLTSRRILSVLIRVVNVAILSFDEQLELPSRPISRNRQADELACLAGSPQKFNHSNSGTELLVPVDICSAHSLPNWL